MRFLRREEVVRLHDDLLDFAPAGAPAEPGVRSNGAIDSALERTEWGPFEAEGDPAERAAFLLRGIIQDHPFVDGNKRTGYVAAYTFLRVNGQRVDAEMAEIVSLVLRTARNEISIGEIATWFRQRTENV